MRIAARATVIPEGQAAVARFLEALAGAPPHLTHISAVFVGQDCAWKMKQAVRFPYLDFTTLAARRHFLERELILNQRTAPEIYHDVVPIRRRANGALGFAGEGEIVEWVLRMAPIPERDFFDVLAAHGALTPPLLRALADSIALFHLALPPIAGWDSAGAFARLIDDNLIAAQAAGLPLPALDAFERVARPAFSERRAALAARAAEGFVRRGHGDLHLGNLCLWRGQPVAFDALEFDEALATIDLGYDIAFLLMDLEWRASREAANLVFNRYVARVGDYGLPSVLPLFLALRALVRCHIAAGRDGKPVGNALLAKAERYLAPPGPGLLLAIGGLPGSGKSTLARALASTLGPAPGALVVRSDEIRKRLHHAAPETRLPPEAYSKAADSEVKRAFFAAAEQALASHHAVIMDASFLDPALRAEVVALADKFHVPFFGGWLEAPLTLLAQRIAARHGDASDATEEVLQRMAATTPPAPPLARGWCRVDARDADGAAAFIRAQLPPALLNAT